MGEDVGLEVGGLSELLVASVEWADVGPVSRMDSHMGAKIEIEWEPFSASWIGMWLECESNVGSLELIYCYLQKCTGTASLRYGQAGVASVSSSRRRPFRTRRTHELGAREYGGVFASRNYRGTFSRTPCGDRQWFAVLPRRFAAWVWS